MFSTTIVKSSHNITILKFIKNDAALYHKFEASCSCEKWQYNTTSYLDCLKRCRAHIGYYYIGFAIIEEE